MESDLESTVIPDKDLTFKNVKKDLLKLVKKNKNEFIKLVDDQLKKYKKLTKK